MGSMLSFVNRIAEEIETEYPDVAIDTLAYHHTRKAPVHMKSRNNVIVRTCSIECSFSHPLEDCCPETEDRDRELDDLPFAKSLSQWKDHCDRIYIWDYTTNFSNYCSSFPNFGVLRRNVRLFAENNVRGVYEQGNSQAISGEFGELRAYLIGKLLWDPFMSEETYQRHIDEFMEGYYGAGAPRIRRFFDRLNRSFEDRHVGIYFNNPVKRFVDPDAEGSMLEKAESFLAKGRDEFRRAKISATPEQKARIRRSEIQLDVYEWYLLDTRRAALDPGTPEWHAAEDKLRKADQKLLDGPLINKLDIFFRSYYTNK